MGAFQCLANCTSMTSNSCANWDLPDPESCPELYSNVLPKRFFAWLADSVLISVFTLLSLPFTAFSALFFLPAMYLIIGFAYRTLTLASGSATWGMMLTGIELRTHEGREFDLRTALLHTLGYSVSISVVILQILSVGLMLTTSRGQGLSDLVL